MADATDEELVRERVMSYLRDRRAFELRAARTNPNGGVRGLLRAARAGKSPGRAREDLEDAYADLQRRHRTKESYTGEVRGFGYSVPPDVDPDGTTIVGLELRGSRATLETTEESLGDGSTERFQYILRRTDEVWLIADRRPWSDADNKWVRGVF